MDSGKGTTYDDHTISQPGTYGFLRRSLLWKGVIQYTTHRPIVPSKGVRHEIVIGLCNLRHSLRGGL